jgi:N-acetylglutamate synthase-like GNAT family acetyltransferase
LAGRWAQRFQESDVHPTPIGSWLRATQAYCQQLCGKETLEYGIAYYSKRFAAIADACQFREVWVADPTHREAAFQETEAWFSSQGLRCLRWAPAEAQPVEQLGPFLIERGFVARHSLIMGLARWIEPRGASGVRILPARAMRAALRQTFGENETLAEASLERLDSPQLDMFVAVRGKQPLGRCGLFQAGDIGQIVELAVIQAADATEVERALLDHVLALAKRLTLPNVVIQLPHHDRDRQSRLQTLGFVAAGEHVEFDRAQG